MRKSKTEFTDKVLAVLRRNELYGFTQSHAAEQLFMSTGSLRRKLAEEHMIYSRLLDQVRVEKVEKYCGRYAAPIAHETGFTSLNGFCDWYKRKFGAGFMEHRQARIRA